MEIAVLGGGCFWCLEGILRRVRGVRQVISGYAGGETSNPTYEAVCTGKTGHAEVVKIEYDPLVITYEDILGLFFDLHDPTTLNRQGADVGTQYRSVIFYLDDSQLNAAKRIIAEYERTKKWPNPIVTELAPFAVFYPAEDYHQDFLNQNGSNRYCQMVIAPKLKKFLLEHSDHMKD